MSVPAGIPDNEEIARVAYAIWEAEGQPEGRDHDHWMRARQLIEEGRAGTEYPQAAALWEEGAEAPRPAHPGFEDDAPGTVPARQDGADTPGRSAAADPRVPEGQAIGDDQPPDASEPRSNRRRTKDPASA